MKKETKKKKYKVTDYSYRSFKKILEEEGFKEERKAKSAHVKFTRATDGMSVVVTAVKIEYPVCQKIFKQIGLK